MAILDIPNGQQVQIPAIQLTNGRPFEGWIKASDGETLQIDLDHGQRGVIPADIDEMCVVCWEKDGIRRSCPVLIRSREPRRIVCQVVIQEKRESPRLRVDVGITYELIAPERVKEVAEAVMAQVNTLDEPDSESLGLLKSGEDPLVQLHAEVTELREMVNEALNRIDKLTALVTGQAVPTQRKIEEPLAVQNCSGTGVGFMAASAFEEGDYLRINMTLREIPQRKIDCVGVVVRCTPIQNEEDEQSPVHYDVGDHFTHIHENDREHLIHYLFKIQRRLLRDRKEARHAAA